MDALLGLRVFCVVAELKSFTAAAERLGLSPAMTSKHIQRVEERVGARLLNRTSRSVSLTEAGMLYLNTVRTVLDGLEQTEAQLAQTLLTPRGVLKVSLPIWMANPSFARLMAAYHQQFPNVVLDLDLSGRKVNLVDEGFDLALRVTPALDETLVARKLATIRFVMVGSPDLLMRLGYPDSLPALQGAPFLAYTGVAPDGRVRLGQGLPDLHLRPIMLSGNETLLHLAAREGIGLSFMPYWLVESDLAEGVLKSVLPEALWPKVTLHAVYPNRSYLPAKMRSFLDFLTSPQGMGGLVD